MATQPLLLAACILLASTWHSQGRRMFTANLKLALTLTTTTHCLSGAALASAGCTALKHAWARPTCAAHMQACNPQRSGSLDGAEKHTGQRSHGSWCHQNLLKRRCPHSAAGAWRGPLTGLAGQWRAGRSASMQVVPCILHVLTFRHLQLLKFQICKAPAASSTPCMGDWQPAGRPHAKHWVPGTWERFAAHHTTMSPPCRAESTFYKTGPCSTHAECILQASMHSNVLNPVRATPSPPPTSPTPPSCCHAGLRPSHGSHVPVCFTTS